MTVLRGHRRRQTPRFVWQEREHLRVARRAARIAEEEGFEYWLDAEGPQLQSLTTSWSPPWTRQAPS